MCSVERKSSGSAFHRVVLCMSACYIYPTREVTPSPSTSTLTLQEADHSTARIPWDERLVFQEQDSVHCGNTTQHTLLQPTRHTPIFVSAMCRHAWVCVGGGRACACVYMREYVYVWVYVHGMFLHVCECVSVQWKNCNVYVLWTGWSRRYGALQMLVIINL